MNKTAVFAEFIMALEKRSLSESTLDSSEVAVLDHLGVTLYGAQKPWSRSVAKHALSESAAGTIPLVGRSETTRPATAARINGVAAHGFELDDLYESASLHPAATVTAAALPAALARGRDGLALLEAIVRGYETMGRLGVATASQLTAFHTTGTHGVLGACTAVASLANMDAAKLEEVWGIGASLSGGLKAFQTGGGEVKRLHAGRSAESGHIAVELFECGLTGPVDVLANDRGFFAAYSGKNARIDALISNESDSPVIDRMYYKPYATCAATHPIIKAIDVLAEKPGFDVTKITRVVVGTSQRGVDQNCIKSPADTMAVQYSLESAVALSVLGSVSDPDSFELSRYEASSAPGIAALVEVNLDPEVEAKYPSSIGGRVTIYFRDGETMEAYEPGLPELAGRQRRAMVEDKFRLLTDEILSQGEQDGVIEAVNSLRLGASPQLLAERLRRPSS